MGILIDTFEIQGDLLEKIEEMDFNFYQGILSEYRNIKNSFSLTISKLNSDIDITSLTSRIVETISQKYNWEYTPLKHNNFDIRISINNQICYISLRITEESLYKRPNRVSNTFGSLKPTIAYSMVYITTHDKNYKTIIDNFCGSGTILCEALNRNLEIYGGDINKECIKSTHANLKSLGYKNINNVKILDATKSPWSNNKFDCAISNLPWNKQIKIANITPIYINTLKEYSRIVKNDGVICLLVSKPQLLVKHIKEIFPYCKIEQYPISFLGQNPTIVKIIRVLE
ncbi:MAG: methyltransferase domain-containing protein [Patescibacteria group bacterium]